MPSPTLKRSYRQAFGWYFACLGKVPTVSYLGSLRLHIRDTSCVSRPNSWYVVLGEATGRSRLGELSGNQERVRMPLCYVWLPAPP